jgi:hypothetical protein
MNVLKFNQIELESYFLAGEIVFFYYRKAFLLENSENCGYFFSNITQATLQNNVLPYTKKGKFHTFKISDYYVKETIPSLLLITV